MQPGPETVTRLLEDARTGREDALHELATLVYAELKTIAKRELSKERTGHTLQPTALVHEAWIRLVANPSSSLASRSTFFASAAHLIRQVLVDHARARGARKRGLGGERQTLSDLVDVGSAEVLDILVLDEALSRLAVVDERSARIVEMRFFAGLEIEDVARLLSISPATVKRDWEVARVWLYRELQER